jgi:predicted O-methyltransferase YrrM
MKRTLTVSVLVLAAAFSAAGQRRGPRQAPADEQYPPVAKTEAEKRILATLDEAVKARALYANVPAPDGRLLRILTESVNAKHVVEIGTSTGLSGMWIGMALQKTGGKLTTFELDKERAATARGHFQKAGLDKVVTIVEGDAHQTVARLKEPIDVVFIDADKEGYVDYLNKLLPLVRPGGLILAHNTEMVPDYMKAVSTSPDVETVVFTPGGGLAVTLKKR